MTTIENQQLIARFNTKGAELISLKSKESAIEYIWQGNPEYWARHAPVLFPIVGRLKDDRSCTSEVVKTDADLSK